MRHHHTPQLPQIRRYFWLYMRSWRVWRVRCGCKERMGGAVFGICLSIPPLTLSAHQI
jgi:hypothetical protein